MHMIRRYMTSKVGLSAERIASTGSCICDKPIVRMAQCTRGTDESRCRAFPRMRVVLLGLVALFPLSASLVAYNAKDIRRSPKTAVAVTKLGSPICLYQQIDVRTSRQSTADAAAPGPPRQAVSVEDLTPTLCTLIEKSGLMYGTVTVLSRHTTTAITINERESRLARDMANVFLRLVPPDERSGAAIATDHDQPGIRYEHNDMDERPESADEAQRCRENGWDVDDPVRLNEWRQQEPINAHSHLISMLLGSSESIPVVDGVMQLGPWQSVLMVDLDGPRDHRTVGVQLMGYTKQ